MVLIRLELDHRRQEVPLILSFCSERRVQHVAASNSTTGWQFENQVTYFRLFFICVNTLIFLLQPLEAFYNCQSSLVSQTHKQDNMGLHFVCVFMSYTRHRGWSQSRLSHLLHSEDYGWPITLLLSLINEDNELLLLPTKPWCSSAGEERERGAGPRVTDRGRESKEGRDCTEKSVWVKEVMVFTKAWTQRWLLTLGLCMHICPASWSVSASAFVCICVCSPPVLYLWAHYRD